MSSISTMTTFGAPLGAVTSKRGGALTLRASISVYVGRRGSAIGSTVRSSLPEACAMRGEGQRGGEQQSREAECKGGGLVREIHG